jgi:hypothetical protein
MADALFNYEVSPQTVYITTQDQHPSVELLTLTITNSTGRDVKVDYFGFIFPVGCPKMDPADSKCNPDTIEQTNAAAMTNDPGSISASVIPSAEWQISRASQPNSFQSTPRVLKANASVVFQFSGVQINQSVGTANIQVYEVTDQSREKILPITKIRSKLRIESFTVRPPVIDVGQLATLSWGTAAASEASLYTIPQTPPNPEDRRNKPLPDSVSQTPGADQRCREQRVQKVELSGSCTVSPKSSTLYILEARGAGPVMTASVPLPVASVGIDFKASKHNIVEDETIYLTWSTTNAIRATLDPDNSAVPLQMPDDAHPQGWPVTPRKDITFVLRAQGTNSSNSASLSVTVTPKVVITSFSGRASGKGQITLTWDGTASVELYEIHADTIGYSFYSGPLVKQVVIHIPERAAQLMQRADINMLAFSIQAQGPGGPATFEPYIVTGIEL